MSNSGPNMTPAQQREEALFAAALAKPLAERAAFLDGACHGAPALRTRLEALLAAHEQPDELLAAPADAARPTIKLDLADAPDEAVGQTLGRYKLLERVGEGGCGVVYVAEQTEPVRRRVALKVIKLGMDTKQVVARFEAERQALAMMDHPNIAKVLDAGTTELGRPYFVMELVRGIRITDYCDQAQLSTKERLDLFIKVCQAIQHAHQKGIIHRDIKPSNILVTLHDGVPVPKVIDFGIAKATEGRLTDNTVYTQLHQFIGTPAYMSPEQAEMSGLDIDTRSDIYSLGVLLYELLAGSTPFDAKELMASGIDAMRKTIREKEPQRPSTKLATLHGDELTTTAKRRSVETSKLANLLRGDLDWIVMKCLEKDRARRYETATGLAADLKRHLNNEPVLARPPSAAYKFQKAFRRNKLVFAAATTVAVALVAGIGVSALQTIRATRAERDQAKLHQVAELALDGEKVQRQLADAQARQLAETLYFNRVALAYREVEANKPAYALKLLEDCPAPLRDWEWDYVRNRCFLTSHQSVQFPARVLALAVSPNGRDLAVTVDGSLQLWELSPTGVLQTNAVLGPLPAVTSELAHAVAFSPDGTQLAAVSTNYSVKLWDVVSRRELRTFHGHTNYIRSVAFHPNGKEIATGSFDRSVRVWDTTTGTEVRRLGAGNFFVSTVAYSPDGQWLAAGTFSYVVKVWEARTGKEKFELRGHLTPVWAVTFSPDSRLLASIGDVTVRVWEMSSGNAVGVLEGHKAQLSGVAFSPNGNRLASAGVDREVKIWDWKTKREVLSLVGHSNSVSAVAFTPGGELISGGFDGTVRVWNALRAGVGAGQEIETLKGPTNRIWALAFAPDGRLFSCSEDYNGFVWDLTKKQAPRRFDNFFDVSLSADGRQVVSTFPARRESVFYLQLLDAYSMKQLFSVVSPTPHTCAALSIDGKHLVAGLIVGDEEARRQVLVWDWRNSTKPRTLGHHDSTIMDIQFSPDGRHLASASEDGMVQVWDATRLSEAQKGRTLWPKSVMRELPKIAFSPNSKRLASGDGFNDVVVLDVETGALALPRLQGHGDMVICVAFSPNEKFLASAGADNTVRLWDARTGKLLRTYFGHTGVINAVAFSPDSRILASGGQDQTIKLWRVESD